MIPSGEDALTIPTFKSRLTVPEHPAGLMRPFLLSYFCGLTFPASPFWGTLKAAPSSAQSWNCPVPVPWWGGVWPEQRQSEHHVLSSHPDTATRTWELGCCSQNKPRLLWGNSGAQKPQSFVLIWAQGQGSCCFLCLLRKCYRGKNYTWIKGTFLKHWHRSRDKIWFGFLFVFLKFLYLQTLWISEAESLSLQRLFLPEE